MSRVRLGIDVPPRYPSSNSLHLGHLVGYSFIELIQKQVNAHVYPLCFDGNGLPIINLVKKNHPHLLPDEIEEKCRELVILNGKQITTLFDRINLSFKKDQYYQTDDSNFRTFSQNIFIKLYKQGVINWSYTPHYYCFNCKTQLAISEVDKVKINTRLFEFSFETEGIEYKFFTRHPSAVEFIQLIAATKGHPLIGQTAIIKTPFSNFEIPIVESQEVNEELGDGLMMVSFVSGVDASILRSNNCRINNILDFNGRYLSGPFFLQTIEEADNSLIFNDFNNIKKDSLFEICSRCQSRVYSMASEELVLSTTNEIVKESISRMASRIEWYPSQLRNNLLSWNNSIKWDWVISRDYAYGTRVPIWNCSFCHIEFVPEEIEQFLNINCYNCSKPMTPINRRLDTWFDSSLTAFYLRQLYNLEDMLRVQGYDIIRTWTYYTMVMGHHLNTLPWSKIIFTPFLFSDTGQQMHTSANNTLGIDKVPNIEYLQWYAGSLSPGKISTFTNNEFVTAERLYIKAFNAKRLLMIFIRDKRLTLNSEVGKLILNTEQRVLNRVALKRQEFRFEVQTEYTSFFNFCGGILERVKRSNFLPLELVTLFNTYLDIFSFLVPKFNELKIITNQESTNTELDIELEDLFSSL